MLFFATSLSSGDLIIIYTDGLDMDFQEITTVGLAHRTLEPKTIADAVFARAHEKCDNQPLSDDATVLVIRVN